MPGAGEYVREARRLSPTHSSRTNSIMAKLGFLFTLSLIIGGVTFANMSSPTAQTPPAPCVTKEFKTEMVKEACTKGGQKQAKEMN